MPRALVRISISRQATAPTPVPSAFATASFAAKRAASDCGRSRVAVRSAGVKTRPRKRSPQRAINAATRAGSIASIPASHGPAASASQTGR